MNKMNSLERVLTTFQFKEPDCVPLFEAWIETEILNTLSGGDPYKARERLKLDCYPISVGHPKTTNAWRTGIDEWGRKFKDGWYIGGVIDTFEKIEKFSPPTEYANAWFPEKITKQAKKKYAETNALYYATHDVCVGLSYMSMGLENFFVALYKNPELVNALLERSTEWTIAMIEQANNYEVNFIMIGDDLAFTNGPMISPKMFRELILPFYKRIVKSSKSPLIWHSDGAIEPLIPMIIEAGFAGIHSLEPNAHLDLSLIKKEYGNKLVLAGNLDVTNVLTQSDLEIVRNDVKRCIRQGAPGGGYLFSSSNSLFKGMVTNSIIEAYNFAKKVGCYPITI
jgi:uroporphyrinogen decarboxylase